MKAEVMVHVGAHWENATIVRTWEERRETVDRVQAECRERVGMQRGYAGGGAAGPSASALQALQAAALPLR